ncbi:18490_t:CDS:2, partial [Racocetra persica]
MSDYYTTSEEKFDSNDDIMSGEEDVNSPNSVVNRENATTTAFSPQEASPDGLTVNYRMQLKTSVIVKVQNFVNKIRHSTVLCDTLRQFCEINKKRYVKPIADVSTHWNSTYNMLHRFNKMRDELSLLVTAHKKQLGNDYLNDEEWEVVDNMVELLKPMLVATELLLSSLYPTISDIRLTFLGLLHLDKFLDNKSHSTEQYMVADSIKFKLNEYWSTLEESTIIATILDPSSKLITFSASDKDAALASLRNIMIQHKSQVLATMTTSTSTSISKLPSKNKRKFFKSLLTQHQTIEQPLVEELEHYL